MFINCSAWRAADGCDSTEDAAEKAGEGKADDNMKIGVVDENGKIFPHFGQRDRFRI